MTLIIIVVAVVIAVTLIEARYKYKGWDKE